MSEYKKEPPQKEKGNSIEHHLGNIFNLILGIQNGSINAHHFVFEEIKENVRKAWDLVPQEKSFMEDGRISGKNASITFDENGNITVKA